MLIAAIALAGLGWATLALIRPPLPGTFSPTGSMSVQRERQTATLLQDGRVLIAGGDYGCCQDFTTLSSAELYDPTSGKFSPTGSMVEAQSGQLATVLKDGRVLVVGGDSTTELYEPSAGKFTAATSLVKPMDSVSTATLLQDGRVLVTGYDESQDASGQGWNYSPMAQIYNPSTATFTVTGAPLGSCLSDSATPLDSGQVLFVGCGDGGDGDGSAQAELYDPATGTFAITGAMTMPRNDPDATLLADGRVLITGGYSNSSDLQPSLASAEIYSPETGTFSATGDMVEARQGHTATLLRSGKVLVAGGWGNSDDPHLDSAELFDPATGSFSRTLWRMVTDRQGSTATLLEDGRVLIAGGQGGDDLPPQLSSAELYNP